MPSTNAIQNKRSSDFTAAYLRVLNSQQPASEDWEAAAELIDAGFAKGKPLRETSSGQRHITELHGFAVTAQGRVYAQQLQEEARKRTLSYRTKKALFGLLMYALGIITVALHEVAKEAAKALFGL